MEILFLEGTEETPEIVFDRDKPEFRVTGKSYMEDAMTHYRKVITWLEEYSKNPNPITNFKFELEYVNTASSKIVFDILDALDKMHLAGNKILVEWHYYEEDEDMLDLGKEFEEAYDMPFIFEEISFDRPENFFEIE